MKRNSNERKTPEYVAWWSMRGRCLNKKDSEDYKRYGERGITVCREWDSFENFLKDMGRRPSEDYSLDRIDNNGNYEPSNCRWATKKQQSRNRRTNRLLTYKNQTKPLCEWSDIIGISQTMLYQRLRHGYTIAEAFERKKYLPRRRKSRIS